MAAYSLDLRERIIDAIEQGQQTKRDLALLFGVHESFLYKLQRQQRQLGHLNPLPHGGGKQSQINEQLLKQLEVWLREAPDATLADLQERLATQHGVKVSRTSVWRALEKLDWPLKKRRAARLKPMR